MSETKRTATPDTVPLSSRSEEKEQEPTFGEAVEEAEPTPRRSRGRARLEAPPPPPPQAQRGGRASRAVHPEEQATWDPGGRIERIERRVTRHGSAPGPSRFAMLANVAAAAGEGTSASEEGALPPRQLASRRVGEEKRGKEEAEEETESEEEERPAKRARPSRPGSAFMHFMYEFRQKQGGGMRVAELSQRASKAWSKMTPEEKEPYDKLLEQEKARYAAEKQKLASPSRHRIEPPREPNQPRRPTGSFFYFLAHFKEEYRRSHPTTASLPVKVLSQLASKAWAEMSVEDRRPYKEKAEAGKKSYAAWKLGTPYLAPEGPDTGHQVEEQGIEESPPAGTQPFATGHMEADSLAANVKERITAMIAATPPLSPVQSQGAAGSLGDSLHGVDQPISGLLQSPLSALQQSPVLHGVPIAEPQQAQHAQQVLMPAASRTQLPPPPLQLSDWNAPLFPPYPLPQGFVPFQPQQAPQPPPQPQIVQQQPHLEYLGGGGGGGGGDQRTLARRLQEQMERQMAVLQSMTFPTPPQLEALPPVVQQKPPAPEPQAPAPAQVQQSQQLFAALPRLLTPLEVARQQLEYVKNLQEVITAGHRHLVPPHLQGQLVQPQQQQQQAQPQAQQPPSFLGHVFTQQLQPQQPQQPFPSYYVVQGGQMGQPQPTLMPPSLPASAFPAFTSHIEQPQVQQMQPQQLMQQQQQQQPQVPKPQQQQQQMMVQQPTTTTSSGGHAQLQAIHEQLVQEGILPPIAAMPGIQRTETASNMPSPGQPTQPTVQPHPPTAVLHHPPPQTLVAPASTPALVLVTPQLPPLMDIAQPGTGQEATPTDVQEQSDWQPGIDPAAGGTL